MDARSSKDHHEIWPDMLPAVLVFCAMATQWRYSMMGACLGLDYTAIKPTADLISLSIDAKSFHDIRILESETLRIRNKR